MSKLIRISESDDWIVDYDRERGMYRVSYFQNNHFVDEHWFDAYEDKEVDNRINEIIERLECNKTVFKREFSKRNQLFGINTFENYLNILIDWIKGLK